MIFRSLIGIIFALLISWLLTIAVESWLTQSKNSEMLNLKDGEILSAIESEIFNLKLTEFEKNTNKNGNQNQTKSYDLLGEKAIVYQNGISEIERVDLKVYQTDSDQYWQIYANVAKYNKYSNQTHLTGAVKAMNPFEKITLETNSLLVLHNQKLITSDDQVYFQMPHQNISALGIEIDYSNQIVEFQANVFNLIDKEQ